MLLTQSLDNFLSLHGLPCFLPSGIRIEIVVNDVLSEALEIRQAVEVGIETTSVCCHECEEFRVDKLLLLLDCDFVWKHLL